MEITCKIIVGTHPQPLHLTQRLTKVTKYSVRHVLINLLRLHHRLVVISIVTETVELALDRLHLVVEGAEEVVLVEEEEVVLEITIEELRP